METGTVCQQKAKLPAWLLVKGKGIYVAFVPDYLISNKFNSFAGMRYAMETAMKLDRRSPEDKKFLFSLIDALEEVKYTSAVHWSRELLFYRELLFDPVK